jgi:hypothetical protein
MPRCIRPCLYIAIAVLTVAVGATLAFNLHLQSAAMQQQLRLAATGSIGLPINVRSAIYTPWNGIRLHGIVIPDMENEGVNFLEASEFQIVFRLPPLLRREFVVSQLCLKEAVLTWRQNAGGQWRIPRHPEKAVSVPGGTPAITRPAPTPEIAEEKPEVSPAFAVSVEGVEVRRSRILFENRDGWPLLDADGINVQASFTENANARGAAKIPEAVLAGLIVSRDLGSSFTLEDGLLTLPDIRGEVSGGALSGRGSIATRSPGSPYEWALQLNGFQMTDLRLPASFGGLRFEGTLAADFALQGRNAPQRMIRGRSRVEVENGRLIPSSYLQGLGQLLGIRELQNINLSEARADFRIEDDFVYVEPLRLRAEDFAVEMRGPVTRAGGLDLQGILLLSPPVAARLTALTRRQLPVTDDPALAGYREVSFRVTGTLEKPQSDLASRLLGGGLGGQIGDFFLNLLGTP